MNVLLMCAYVIVLIILTLMYESVSSHESSHESQEHFDIPMNNTIDSVTAWSYPEESIKLSEENVNIVVYNPEGITPFFGHQNPIGAEIWYARTPMDAIDSVPLSTTFVSPYCCPSEYSTSTGCLCYGNAGKILNNIRMNTK